MRHQYIKSKISIGSLDLIVWCKENDRLLWIDGWKNPIRSPLVIMNMQLNTVLGYIRSGKIFEAIPL